MGRKVCVLLPRVGVYPALGSMLAETFSGLGWQAAIRHQASPEALDHDLLLLMGLCRYIEGLPALLQQRRKKSPVTVLWQLEPLPPVQLSAAGETVGFRVAACDWGRIPSRPRRVLNFLAPFRTKLLRLSRRCLARPYTRQVVRDPGQQGWKRYDVENYFNALADWRWIKNAHASGGLDFCFASVQPRTEFLLSRGIPAELLPFGYHPYWGTNQGQERNLEVLFLGKVDHGPRGEAIRRLEKQLALRGRKITFVRSAQGEARTRLLNRTRIMINLLRAPHDLAGLRVLLGMACGTLVMSEYCEGTGAFLPGKHFVMAEQEQLAETIDYYLTHEEERRKIADEGHRFVTQELTLSHVIRNMLQRVSLTI